MNAPRDFVWRAALALIVIGLAFLNGKAWLQHLQLQMARDLLRSEADELARLRAENERLEAKQIPAAELARLHSDHEALQRLRAELDTLARGTAKP